jgi:hypothetical protein
MLILKSRRLIGYIKFLMNAKTSYQSIGDLTGLTLFKRLEGGAVYTQESNGKYCVVIDESSIASLLPPEELDDMEFFRGLEFNSEQERLDYLSGRFDERLSLKDENG